MKGKQTTERRREKKTHTKRQYTVNVYGRAVCVCVVSVREANPYGCLITHKRSCVCTLVFPYSARSHSCARIHYWSLQR